ncbi:MAG: 1-acyl-sn-glycerol-3-phosphate acyltransferase [Oscillospiraceae bacterium]|jgi:1-acyl-sn-glycerol-3-phosphate acyltransferase|nr:1-acyl-sn-glycerol-3-phosphate acyltransferase [Oscillospiraceae bacterium]
MEKEKAKYPLYIVLRNVISPLLRLIYKLDVKGVENIPKSGAFIVCANHTSNIDAPLLGIAMKRPVRFMSKSELYKNRALSFFFYKIGAFPVKRKNVVRGTMDTSFEILKNGEVLGIFIEGTRSKDGELLRPKSGASAIAIKANVPILPVCISCVERRGRVKIFLKTKVEFGNIIFPEKILKLCKTNAEPASKPGVVGLKSDFKIINQAIMKQILEMKDRP